MNNITRQFTQATPEDATRAARRSLILSAVVCRGSIDSNSGDPEAASLYNRLLQWLTEIDLEEEVEPSEELLLHAPLGKLKKKDIIQATWHVEGVAVLSWALKQFEFPRHDEKVDPYAATDSVGFLREDAVELLLTAGLRNQMQLKAARELLYAIRVRLRDFIRSRTRKDFTLWIEQEWLDTLKLPTTYLITDHDLTVDGKPLGEAEYDRVQECSYLAYERYRAIAWLVERYQSYYKTPIDT